MSSIINTVSKVNNSILDPNGIFTTNNLWGSGVNGKKPIFGKTGAKVWDTVLDPGANYEKDFLQPPVLPDIVAAEDPSIKRNKDADQAAFSEAARVKRRGALGSSIKTSGQGVLDPPAVGTKKILG